MPKRLEISEVRNRVLEEAHYICATKDTLRGAESIFSLSKTTIHNDMIVRLPLLDIDLAKEVQNILQQNKEDGRRKGGLITGERRRHTICNKACDYLKGVTYHGEKV